MKNLLKVKPLIEKHQLKNGKGRGKLTILFTPEQMAAIEANMLNTVPGTNVNSNRTVGETAKRAGVEATRTRLRTNYKRDKRRNVGEMHTYVASKERQDPITGEPIITETIDVGSNGSGAMSGRDPLLGPLSDLYTGAKAWNAGTKLLLWGAGKYMPSTMLGLWGRRAIIDDVANRSFNSGGWGQLAARPAEETSLFYRGKPQSKSGLTSLKFLERKPVKINLGNKESISGREYIESPRDVSSDVGDLIAEGSERSIYISKSNPNIVYKIEDAPLDNIKNIKIRKEVTDDIIAPETTVGYYNRNGKYYRVTLLDKYKSWNPDDFDINYSPELDLEIINTLLNAGWKVELGAYNGAPYARSASKNGITIGNLEYFNWGRDPHGNLKLIDLYVYSLKQGGKMFKFKSGIKIKPSHKGLFTDYCGGEVTNECILRGKHSSNPAVRKRATFALNARHFKHKLGGVIKADSGTKFTINDGLALGSLLIGNLTNSIQQNKFIDSLIKANKALSKYLQSQIWNNSLSRAKDFYTKQFEENQKKFNSGESFDNPSLIVAAHSALDMASKEANNLISNLNNQLQLDNLQLQLQKKSILGSSLGIAGNFITNKFNNYDFS